MLANELIDRLERRGLLDQEIIEALREQLLQGGARVKPEAVAKLLVDNGQLTRYQATQLIGELRNAQQEAGSELAAEPGAETEEELTALLIDEDDEEEPIEAQEVLEATYVPDDDEADIVDAEAIDDAELYDDPAPARRPSGRRQPPPQESVWDSFKVYGYLGIIGFLCLAAFGLYFVLNKGNADDLIDSANELYSTQSYQPAQDAYLAFLDSFGDDNQYSSLARTRITMAELYRAEEMSDPTAALDLAKEKLPGLVDEEGLNQERGNLAELLVEIAENIAVAAGEATETAEKQRLLGRLDEQMELMDNPNYVLSSMKTTLSAKLLALSETRNRVRRDIERNLRLDETERSMVTELEQDDTKAAYEHRRSLLRDFPELHDNERLVTLIERASDLQQTLVKPAAELPETLTEPADSASLQSIVLTSLHGDSVPGLQGEAYYLRAGGSVLAFNAEDGRLLWRKFTGFGEDHTPVRLDDGRSVLLSDVQSHEVRRHRGNDGELVWRSRIEEPFPEPVATRNAVLVSAESGRLISLDTESGEPNWATQIPQTLSVSPGVDERRSRVYLPGDHSNLYVLSARDGRCMESFYIGHREGTVKVPPVSLLGHLFVIENAGSDYARMHVLRMNDSGEELEPAQPPFRLSGNVRVPPVVLDRRVIVLTDLGQVVVFDIEPTAEREQVSRIAEQPASYDSPTLTRMAVGRGQMWITGTRIGRFELQVNTGRVVYDWGKHEGDTFVGQPLALDDAVVHARVLRGTSAVRVTAAEPSTGEPIWSTDVGTPISMIRRAESGFHVVTSQGALFELDREALEAGSTRAPIENPGQVGIAMRFENPVAVDETRRILLNQSQKGQALVYDPTRRSEKLRKITLAVTGAKPTGEVVFSGGGLLLPLDSGRIVLMQWQTGSVLGAPFQPPSSPTNSVEWTDPVTLPDDPDQVVIADSREKIYRLRVGDQIRELASETLEAEFLGTTAGMGDIFAGTMAGPSADRFVGYDMTTLEKSFDKLLDGRVIWGPVAVDSTATGPAVMLITDDRALRVFDAEGEETFSIPMPLPGIPVDRVREVDDDWLLTGREGWVLRVDPERGVAGESLQLGQPLSAPPLQIGNRLLVPGAEGVVYVTELPGESP